VDCSLKAGVILYDGLRNKKVYNKEILITVPLKKLNNNKYKTDYNSSWRDKECAILINKRKWAYKKLSKCPSRKNLVNYRNISSYVRKELHKKKRVVLESLLVA